MFDFLSKTEGSVKYNFHTHTEFCDGRSPMSDMVSAALSENFSVLGFTPHSPLAVESGCNMAYEAVPEYLSCVSRLKSRYDGSIEILTSMEIDWLSPDFGPHIDYFQKLPLDYRLGSVHFVPTRDGIPIDCDGSRERFIRNLRDAFAGDLRYVVEMFFVQELEMIEHGGFDLLGHFDKIAANASAVDPDIESRDWYRALIEDVVSHALSSGLTIEINTKYLDQKDRSFPSSGWIPILVDSGLPYVIDSDAHEASLLDAGRTKMIQQLLNLKK